MKDFYRHSWMICALWTSSLGLVTAQDKLSFSGNLQAGLNWFLEDVEIGAANTPQYDDNLLGLEMWLDLQFKYKGYTLGVRGDAFHNSNLLNPNDAYSAQGLGRIYLHKKFGNLEAQAGYIYDQIGSGLIFRSYEERPLLIDNALVGGLVKYQPWDWLEVKAMAGRQKNLFEWYDSFIRGGQIEGFFVLGQENSVSIIPGFGVVNSSWSDGQVSDVIKALQTHTPADSIGFYYHTWSFTGYSTVAYGPFSLYLEGAFKTQDIYFDPDQEKQLYGGGSTLGRFRNDDGSILFGSFTYGSKGFSANVSLRRTKNFTSRADPFTTLNRGLVNYLPPMSRLNSARLKARYTPAARDISEKALQAELRYTFSKKIKMVQYFSHIAELDGNLLYREFDNEITFRQNRFFQCSFGVQSQSYNQAIYEGKSGVEVVQTVVPYLEVQKRLKKRKSIRSQLQYMHTDQDFGSWIFALFEYNMAPRWSFSVSDMYNVDPEKTDDLHYPRLDIIYNIKTHRMMFSYLKQVEGVVCAGGICRLEPAFSGFRFSLQSSF